jgi:flagellar biosynthetic protein FliP
MAPTFTRVYEEAYVPFSNEEINQEEFFDKAMDPLREFMLRQVDEKDLNSMCEIGGVTEVENIEEDVPTTVLIPAFIISELRTAFWIGFLIYVPFLVIDMVVSSTLMSMGMMMLPPTTISMPFKILLFVLADGWNLIIVNLVQTFR